MSAMESQQNESQRQRPSFDWLVNGGGAVLLLVFWVTWWATLSHLAPSAVVAVGHLVVLVAAVGIASSRARIVPACAAIAAAICMLALACTYRLPALHPVKPAIDISENAGLAAVFALLTAMTATFLWTRLLRCLEAGERTRFILFLLGLAPLLLLSADMAYVLRAPLQPLRPVNYHPFLTYPVEGSYGYSHATEAEVVDLKGVTFRQQKPDDVIRIVLCGASTVWGYQLEESESLPRVLQSELDRRFPNQRIEVLTLAFPGKFQLNELIDAVVTLPHWNPDVVISLNGFNEVWYGEEEDRYEGMPYIEEQMRSRGTFSCLATRFSHVGAHLYALNHGKRTSPYRIREADKRNGSRYADYLRATAANLKRRDIPYVYSFCPNISEKTIRSASEESVMNNARDEDDDFWIEESKTRRAAANVIVREEQQHAYDVMKPLSGAGETLFIDECHLNAEGVRRVAADLARQMPRWCPRLPQGDEAKRQP